MMSEKPEVEGEISGSERILHVFDLPQIYSKPNAKALLSTLHLLAQNPRGFSPTTHETETVDPAGVPRYLTSIISSPLGWISDDDVKERIWALASLRLNARSGSHAAPNQTRSFQLNDLVRVQLYEPSLTGDNLGLKTWASALLMSKRLGILLDPVDCLHGKRPRILELGAGTGLVGISAASVWGASVTLTDLPEILPNLTTNVQLNEELITSKGGFACARALDWSDYTNQPKDEEERYPIVLAADPIYSPAHPAMLSCTIKRWLREDQAARVMIELPLREHYVAEREQLRTLLNEGGLELMSEGTESGYDDWYNADGSIMEVQCWWGVWKRERERELG